MHGFFSDRGFSGASCGVAPSYVDGLALSGAGCGVAPIYSDIRVGPLTAAAVSGPQFSYDGGSGFLPIGGVSSPVVDAAQWAGWCKYIPLDTADKGVQVRPDTRWAATATPHLRVTSVQVQTPRARQVSVGTAVATQTDSGPGVIDVDTQTYPVSAAAVGTQAGISAGSAWADDSDFSVAAE